MVKLILDQVDVQTVSANGTSSWSLKDISITCRSEERIGIMGCNGSGKTTLARLLGGLDQPTRGKLQIEPKQARIVLVLQRPEDHFMCETVGQQIASYASGRLNPINLHNLLAKVGLSSDIEKYPPLRLSGGQQRLVTLACALATDASFLVLDEPLTGLDSHSRQLVTQALSQLNTDKNLGIIIISHHPDDLIGLVDRLWILDEGKLAYDGLFLSAPIEILSKCLASNDTSLYYILRQLESRGIDVPKSVYRNSKPEEISRLLLGEGIS